jgi:hypothetical protein
VVRVFEWKAINQYVFDRKGLRQMFSSRRVACYLNGFAGHGDDPDAKELKLVFHIAPIIHMLAQEISPKIADRLFRDEGADDGPEPAQEITKVSFAGVQVPMCNITFDELPEPVSKLPSVIVHGAAISNLRAAKIVAGASNFRLEFDVVVPMDRTTMHLVEKYYKAACFLTMEEIQRKLEEPADQAQVEVSMSLQDAADEELEPVAAGEGKPSRKRRGKDAAVKD